MLLATALSSHGTLGITQYVPTFIHTRAPVLLIAVCPNTHMQHSTYCPLHALCVSVFPEEVSSCKLLCIWRSLPFRCDAFCEFSTSMIRHGCLSISLTHIHLVHCEHDWMFTTSISLSPPPPSPLSLLSLPPPPLSLLPPSFPPLTATRLFHHRRSDGPFLRLPQNALQTHQYYRSFSDGDRHSLPCAGRCEQHQEQWRQASLCILAHTIGHSL